MTEELDENEALAAEYVLGTLDPAARAAVQQRLAGNGELARQVELWERRLAPLAAAVPPVEPPLTAWLGIAQALAAEARPAPSVRRVRVRRHGRLYSVSFWRACTLGAGALAAVLALYVAGSALRPPAAPIARYVAVLDRSGTTPALIVTVEPAAGRVLVRPLAIEPAGDRALELWLVAGQGRPPRSLGLLDPKRQTTLQLPAPAREALEPRATLVVSLEAPGGSPSGRLTGPVMYRGPLFASSD